MLRVERLFTFILLLFPVSSFPDVSTSRLLQADQEPGSWLTHGRNYAEDRESPLTGITPDNVNRLGLAWYFDTGTSRGLEASPLVIDGVIYSTGSWSRVYANDAVTGEPLWSYDPRVPRSWGANACCDVVNRGVAAWADKIYAGTIDGRLIALDKDTGRVVWETLTIDPSRPYTITGAPRVVNGLVMIGNGGAEYGVRGYLSAWDASTGEMRWRFYTVPGDPSRPFESEAMEMAARTWTGDVWYRVGGGGTVWDSMAYDPDLNLLYFGVGNGAPWNRSIRSPGGGDNLFLSSIVAVDATTGKYVWHYQTTPADTWDYTATQHMILASLTIEGAERQVLMQAPKNGFFYVLDRKTGELLSAEKYTRVNWASHIDPETGRPVETGVANHATMEEMTSPAPTGGHNWQPMAFNHGTGLVYIPAMESMAPYSTTPSFRYLPGHHWNTGQRADAGDDLASLPPALISAVMKRMMKGRLIAWDPVRQRKVWQVDHRTMWNGGVLTTASGLVFQGTGDGRLVAYDAGSGETLWETPTGTGVIAPPVSYAIDGHQYIAVMAGWGGAGGLIADLPGSLSGRTGRLLVYRLDADGELPAIPEAQAMPKPPQETGDDESVRQGSALYSTHCLRCHGVAADGSGVVPDLRYMDETSHAAFNQIVLGGIFSNLGMPAFGDVLEPAGANAIHDYILHMANRKWEEDASPLWWQETRNWIYDRLAILLLWLNQSLQD